MMQMTTKLFVTALASAVLAGTTSAAVSIDSTASGDTAPTLDNSYGTLDLAIDYDGPGGTVDGIAFTSVTHGNQNFPSTTIGGITVALDATGLGYNQADLGDPNVYQAISYTNQGEDVVMNITGLDAGRNYQIQFLVGEPRGNSWANYNGTFGASDNIVATATISGDPNEADVTTNVQFGSGSVDNLLVTVLVSGTTEAQLLLANDGGLGPGVGGVVIHSVVPEPSSLALLGLGGLLVARRRRG